MSVVGAWDEVMDRLADAGVAIDVANTALELAAHARQREPDRPFREQRALTRAAPFLPELAAIATQAAFSRTPPSAQEASRAWQLEADLSQVLYRGWRGPYRAAHWAFPLPRRRAVRRR